MVSGRNFLTTTKLPDIRCKLYANQTMANVAPATAMTASTIHNADIGSNETFAPGSKSGGGACTRAAWALNLRWLLMAHLFSW